MSLQAMQSAGSGMAAFQFNLDTIANNLANAGTTAFKRSRVNFEDLYYEQIKAPGSVDSAGNLAPTGIAVGFGARVASTEVDHSAGSILQTGGELDIAITGDGFFQVADPGGGPNLYTRAGAFSINATGQVVMTSADRGRLIDPSITIPNDTTDISISGDGVVSVLQAGSTTLTQIGNIQLARFINPQGLMQLGENLYRATDASGPVALDVPGQNGLGTLRQNALEASNVEPVQELVDLIKTQRNFELNTQVLQAGDQLLQLAANLRRF